MNTVRCSKGHYYDADLFSQCPHCEKSISIENNSDKKNQSKDNEKKSSHSRRKGNSKVNEQVVNTAPAVTTDTQEEMAPPAKKNTYNDVTVAIYDSSNASESKRSRVNGPKQKRKSKAQIPNDAGETVSVKIEQPTPMHSPIRINTENTADENDDEQDVEHGEIAHNEAADAEKAEIEVQNEETVVSKSVEQKTESQPARENTAPLVQPSSATTMPAGSKTVGFYNFENEPVVGWLVCVTGDIKGKCFKLKSGQNIIGSSGIMDVYLPDSGGRHSQKYALLIFEPKKQVFFLQPDSTECSLNSSPITNYVQLNDYDVLQFASYKLIFKGLCGDRFDWKETEN